MLCSLIRLRRNSSSTSFLHHLSKRFYSSSTVFAAASAAMVVHAKDESYLSATIPKRISLFEAIQAEQQTRRLSLSPDPIKVTLPDGKVKEGKKWQTTPFDVAREISKNLANNALISKVNGVLWDMNRPLEEDSLLQIFKFDDDEGRDTFWHSSAHILGQSLETEYGCKLCIGPCTTRGEGFYYDAFYGELGLNDDHFKQIEAGALKAVAEKQPFERIEVTRDQALEIFSDNKFKVEIINDLPADKTITVYRCGPLIDLCRGPHIPNTSFVKAIACLKASSAYWRGDKDRESLQRVYGISYPDQKSLKEYLHRLEEAKKYDHRILGVKQELILHHEWSPGSWFFLPHGTRVYNKLMNFIRNQYRDRGYQEVISPNMYNMELWKASGHAEKYKDDMFVLEVDKQEFGLKPMNCPGHCLMFKHRVRSYRELPLRFADFGVLHRNEASGALSGLTRVRRFQQDDAHIFCTESQVKDEVRKALDFIDYVYQIFGFTYELKLSTRPENKLGDDETWDRAESALKEALDEFGKPWQVSSAWLLYKSSTAGNGFLSATLQGFSVFDDREGVEQGFRLAIGKPESIGASPPSTLSYYENQESIDSSSSKGNNFEPVQTMLIVDMKFGPDSTFVSVCIQRPQLLVALDFLLAVVEFFVPTVSSMLSFEEHNSSMLDAIIIDQSIYKQPCAEFSLSPQKPLIVDDENFDHFIYDGDGGILYLKDGRGLNLTSASSEAIIYIGNGKKLQFRNVVIKGGQHLDSCVFLGANSSYSALNDDHVYLEQSVESPQAISPRGSVHEVPSQNNAANSSAEVIVELQVKC